jgi:hypothetical protein
VVAAVTVVKVAVAVEVDALVVEMTVTVITMCAAAVNKPEVVAAEEVVEPLQLPRNHHTRRLLAAVAGI